MLKLFSIKISDFITVWLLKCFIADFADFGAFSGGHLAGVAISLVKYVNLTSYFFIVYYFIVDNPA